jgi:uncharacterized membrane protein
MFEKNLLDTISRPADLRNLKESDLRQVADELRAETIDAVSVTGGHLGAGLGVVELTVALHSPAGLKVNLIHSGRRILQRRFLRVLECQSPEICLVKIVMLFLLLAMAR